MGRQVVVFLLVGFVTSIFAQETELLYYRPYIVSYQQPSLSVASEQQGTCLQQSQLIRREDAWRCMAGGQVYDPCFKKPFSKQQDVLCVENPWSLQAIKVKLPAAINNKLHQRLDLSTAFPWALQLIDGEKCYAIMSDERYDGLYAHYICNDKSMLYGELHRCSSLWTVLKKEHEGLSMVNIAKAWF
jgi:hypothetical protein